MQSGARFVPVRASLVVMIASACIALGGCSKAPAGPDATIPDSTRITFDGIRIARHIDFNLPPGPNWRHVERVDTIVLSARIVLPRISDTACMSSRSSSSESHCIVDLPTCSTCADGTTGNVTWYPSGSRFGYFGLQANAGTAHAGGVYGQVQHQLQFEIELSDILPQQRIGDHAVIRLTGGDLRAGLKSFRYRTSWYDCNGEYNTCADADTSSLAVVDILPDAALTISY